MSQAMKAKKIAERAKKARPGRKDDKAMKHLHSPSLPKAPSGIQGLVKSQVRTPKADAPASEIARLKIELEQEWVKCQNYRLAAESATNLIYNWDLGSRVEWLGKVDELLGYQPNEIPRTWEGYTSLLYPEDRDRVLAAIQKQLKDDEPYSVESRVQRKDGTYLYWQDRGSVIRDKSGKPVKWVGAVSDITERKRAEEKLKIFQKAIEGAYDSFVLTDMNGNITYANEPAIRAFGYLPEEIMKFNVTQFIANPEDAANIIKKTKEKKNWNGELTAIRKNNTTFPAVLSASLLEDDKGNPTGMLDIFRDITERSQAEERIRNSLAEKEVLLKEVHHRVKNNLMILIGLIKMQETKTNDERFNDLFKELEGRVRSMAEVHENLHKSENLARINLQNYIKSICAYISANYGTGRDIHFSVQVGDVEVGPDIAISCGLILNELITNAYKHAFPENKPCSGAVRCEINVIASLDGDELTLTVANNGVGLPVDLDLEKSETLGLRLVQMLIKQINGSIELDRSAGTAFIMKFPLADKIH